MMAQYNQVTMAKTALAKMVEDDSAQNEEDTIESTLKAIMAEKEGLELVHAEINKEWAKLAEIGKQNFMRMDTRELAKQMRELEEHCARFPNKMKTYKVFQKFLSVLAGKKKMT